MSKNTEQYKVLARTALKIMEIDFEESEDLERLCARISNPILIPATETEWEISRLAREISEKVKSQGEISLITILLDHLNSEVVFSKLD